MRQLNDEPGIDVIIVARGGGSMEVWPFNEEIVARAIFASAVPSSPPSATRPTTIADFVADKRAPTPSAAAEMVAPTGARSPASIEGVLLGSTIALKNRLHQNLARIERAEDRLASALPVTSRLASAWPQLMRRLVGPRPLARPTR